MVVVVVVVSDLAVKANLKLPWIRSSLRFSVVSTNVRLQNWQHTERSNDF